MPRSITILLALLPATALAFPKGEINFTDATVTRVASTSTEQSRNEKEVELADFDNDGDLDMVLAIAGGVFGNRTNKIYRNDGGVLTEITASMTGFNVQDLSRRALLRDYDNDGWLDLVIINDQLGGGLAGATKYWRNNHPGGVFTGFTYDLAPLNGAIGYACGADAQDYDQDGYVDIWFGNYPNSSQDKMFMGGAGGMSEAPASMVPRDGDYTTDISSADLNGDGWMDVVASNHWDPAWVYYNNLSGTAPGDFDQPNSTQQLTAGVQYHNAMEPGDLDGDGRVDLYASNWNGEGDAFLMNNGNDANGRVSWNILAVPGQASLQETAKATVADLNGDDRPELIVSAMDGRPVILRNVSRPGQVAFIDWTPPGAVADNVALASFTTGVADLSGDGRPDIIVPGNVGEHVLEAVGTPRFAAASLGGSLPAVTSGPITVYGFERTGSFSPFTTVDLTSGKKVSVVARSCGDISLSSIGGVTHTSDREGQGNEEYLSFTASGNVTLTVAVTEACGDADLDGDVDAADRAAAMLCVNGSPSAVDCNIFDVNLDGRVTQVDVTLMGRLSGGNAPRVPFLLEILAR